MQYRESNRLHPEVGESLLEFFIKNIVDNKSVKNIIRVLSIINGHILNHVGCSSSEIYDFGNYFIANGYELLTRQERKKSFGGNDALILNRYYEIAAKIEREEILEMIEDISPEESYEALTLTNAIFNINNEAKIITLSTEDGPTEFRYGKKYKSNEIEVLKQEFFNYMAYAIVQGTAGIIVRIKKKPKDLLLGIKINNGKWEPLRVYEFIEEYEEGLDLSVRYTEISRKDD